MCCTIVKSTNGRVAPTACVKAWRVPIGSAFKVVVCSKGHSEQTATELAVMAAEIEQLPDRTGFLKFASQPGWMRVAFPVYQLPNVAVPFVPIQ